MKLQELIDKYRYPADASEDPTARQLLEELEGLARPVAMKDLSKQLEELVPLAAAATQGPWTSPAALDDETGKTKRHPALVIEGPTYEQNYPGDCHAVRDTVAELGFSNHANHQHNRAFICAARNFLTPDNLPKLAAALAAPIEVERPAATPVPSLDMLQAMLLDSLPFLSAEVLSSTARMMVLKLRLHAIQQAAAAPLKGGSQHV